jgi:hypothetical protein
MSVSGGGLLRRRWMVIVAAFVVAIAGFGVYRLHGIFGSNDVVSWPRADSIENSDYNPKRVLFEVFGSPGAVATINYLDEHAQPQRVDDAKLPWSHVLTTTDPIQTTTEMCGPSATHGEVAPVLASVSSQLGSRFGLLDTKLIRNGQSTIGH